jgi:hypothetical protein
MSFAVEELGDVAVVMHDAQVAGGAGLGVSVPGLRRRGERRRVAVLGLAKSPASHPSCIIPNVRVRCRAGTCSAAS